MCKAHGARLAPSPPSPHPSSATTREACAASTCARQHRGAHVQWPSFPRGTCTPGGKTAAFLFFGTGPHDAPAHASNGTCDECMHLRHRVGARHRRVGGKSRDRAARAAASPDGRQSDSVTSRSFTPCRAIWCLWPSFTIVTRDRLVGSKVVYECILTTLTSHLYLTSVLQHAKPLTQRR